MTFVGNPLFRHVITERKPVDGPNTFLPFGTRTDDCVTFDKVPPCYKIQVNRNTFFEVNPSTAVICDSQRIELRA